MRIIDFYIFGLMLILFCSCGSKSKHDAVFNRIDQLCDSVPEQAIQALDSIDRTSFSESDRYRFDLLTIKSRDKAYIAHTSDSLILEVIDYYAKHREEGLYAEALYYGGRVYSDIGDLPTALEFFQKSLDEIPEDKEHRRFKSTVLNQTGRLLHALRLDSAAVDYLEKSLSYIDGCQEVYGMTFTHALIAGSHRGQGKYELAHEHMEEAVKLSTQLEKKDRNTILTEFAYILYKEGKIDTALCIIRPLPHSVDSITSPFCLAVAANIYKEAGILDTAYKYARQLTRLKTPNNKKTGYKVIFSEELKNFVSRDTMIKLIPEYKQTIEDYLDTHEAEQAISQNSLYNYRNQVRAKEKAEADSQKLRIFISILICGFAVVLLLAIILILWRKYHQTKKSSDLMEAMVIIEKLKDKTEQEDKSSRPTQFNEHTDNTSEEITLIKRGIVEQIQVLKSKNPRPLVNKQILDSHVYVELKEKVDTRVCIKDSEDLLKRLQDQIELITPGFSQRLDMVTEWNISPKEKKVAYLMKCGFSNSQIATLLSRSTSTISAQRKAIAQKTGFAIDIIDIAIAIL